MKSKILALMLALTMVLSLAACGTTNNTDSSVNNNSNAEVQQPVETPEVQEPEVQEPEVQEPIEGEDEGTGEESVVVQPNSSADFLNHVWELHEDETKFAIIGGSFSDESVVQDMAGSFSIADPMEVDSMLGLPAAEIDKVVNAASIQHMMNTNTFTCSAYELAEGVDVQALADAVKTAMEGRQWMCGFPDKYIVTVTDTHFVIMFGAAEIVDNFEAKVEAHDATAKVIYNENLA